MEEELNEEDEEVVFEKDWRNDIVLCSVFRLSRRVSISVRQLFANTAATVGIDMTPGHSR